MSSNNLLKDLIGSVGFIKIPAKFVYSNFQRVFYKDSSDYWVNRYKSNGNSGSGSYGRLAEFKADVINKLVADENISSVIEFGCGDGNQLLLAKYPSYTGYDISDVILARCKKLFEKDSSKAFFNIKEYDSKQAELALSLDVIYHLTEDTVFEDYMKRLFSASNKFVLIYSSNTNTQIGVPFPHIKHRFFSDWIKANASEWVLVNEIKNPYPYDDRNPESSFADFFLFKKST